MFGERRLFGTNGIRGLANKELTPELAVKIGTAIGTFFKRGKLIVGYDARTSGPMLTKAVTSGLNSMGCSVLLAGMVPTPTLQFATKTYRSDGGVIITASHNPPEYNGIKVLWKDGIEISREQEIQIENTFFDEKAKPVDWTQIGQTAVLPNVIDEYVEAIETHVNVQAIRKKQYHIIVDSANSVGGLVAPPLLRDLGCKVTTLNGNIDGTFSGRPPEPRPENLGELAMMVKIIKADLGVAFDGDADRSIFVDEKGVIHMGDQTFALVEKHFLQKHRKEKIVTPVSSSSMVKEVADAYGGEIVWTKVGSVTVAHTMKQIKAKLGGEENGGIFYGPHQPVRDGAMSTALIMDIMARTNQKLSQLIDVLPKYFLEKSKVECPENLKEKVLEKLVEQMKHEEINTIDGVKVWFKDRSAILMRPSGTEPIYRLYAEAKNAKRAKQLVDENTSRLKRIIRGFRE